MAPGVKAGRFGVMSRAIHTSRWQLIASLHANFFPLPQLPQRGRRLCGGSGEENGSPGKFGEDFEVDLFEDFEGDLFEDFEDFGIKKQLIYMQ